MSRISCDNDEPARAGAVWEAAQAARIFRPLLKSVLDLGLAARTSMALHTAAVLLALLLAVPRAVPAQTASHDSLVHVLIETEVGDFVARLYPAKAPSTVSNFLEHVDNKLYDGGSFYRTVRAGNQPTDSVKISVVQANAHPWKRATATLSSIKLERTSMTGLRHEDGCLSMARGEPNTATTSFFICVGEQPELDFGGKRNPDRQGFAVFGRIIKGMEVVRDIHGAPADGQALVPPVHILRVSRIGHRSGVR